jgi:hypothetical protein
MAAVELEGVDDGGMLKYEVGTRELEEEGDCEIFSRVGLVGSLA